MENRKKIGKTAAYYASYITIGFATGIIGPSLPTLSEHAGTDLGGISYLFPILSIGYIIGSFFSGRIYDKAKGHPVMAVAVVLILGAIIFIPASPFLGLIIALFLIVGLGSGAVDVGGNTLIMWTHGDKVGPFMVGLHFFYGLGAFLAPLAVGQALKATGDVTWAFRALAIICVPITLLFVIFKSPKNPKVESGSSSKGSSTILVLLLSLFMFLHVGAELSFGGWIYSFALKMKITGEAGAAYLTSAFWGALTVSRLISVAIALKVRARNMLIADVIGCIAASLILALFPGSRRAVWIGSILLGAFIASLVPATFTFAGKYMDMSGKVAGWFVIGLGAGNLFFPWLIGQLFEPRGAVALPVVNLFTFVAALGVIIAAAVIAGKRQSGRPA